MLRTPRPVDESLLVRHGYNVPQVRKLEQSLAQVNYKVNERFLTGKSQKTTKNDYKLKLYNRFGRILECG